MWVDGYWSSQSSQGEVYLYRTVVGLYWHEELCFCCYPSLTVQGVEISREDEAKWVIASSRNFEGVASINGIQWWWAFSFKGPVDTLAAMPSDILFVNERFCFYRGRIQSYMVFGSDDDVIMRFWRYLLAEIAHVSRWQHSMLYAWIHAKEDRRKFVSLSRIWSDSPNFQGQCCTKKVISPC